MNPRCDILLRRQLARIPSVRERALRKSSERAGWSRQPWSHSPVKLQRDCQGAWQKLSPASSRAFCSISTFGRMPQLGGGHCRGTSKQSTAAVRPRLGLLREGPPPHFLVHGQHCQHYVTKSSMTGPKSRQAEVPLRSLQAGSKTACNNSRQ